MYYELRGTPVHRQAPLHGMRRGRAWEEGRNGDNIIGGKSGDRSTCGGGGGLLHGRGSGESMRAETRMFACGWEGHGRAASTLIKSAGLRAWGLAPAHVLGMLSAPLRGRTLRSPKW